MVDLDVLVSEIFAIVYSVFESLLQWIAYPIFLFLDLISSKKFLPPIQNDEILLKSATCLAKRIRLGEVTSEDVVRAYINRIQEVNSHLNAVVEDRFEDALAEAREVDEFIASKKKTPEQIESETPFLGVPFTVKESCKVKGMTYCVGSLLRKGIRAYEDGEAVRNMKQAGAIVIAVTNTPEWCLSFETQNFVTGRTLNPYDPLRTPGGSSGGEAALISSAASIFGVASDIAGSIRIPSMFTGIFGHKPTPGYIPIVGHFPELIDPKLIKMQVVGPMCRYAEDLIPLMKAMAGSAASKLQLNNKVEIEKLKVFYIIDMESSIVVPINDQIKQVILNVVHYLNEAHGATIMQTRFKLLKKCAEINLCTAFYGTIFPSPFEHPENLKASSNVFAEAFKSLFGLSLYSPPAFSLEILKFIYSMFPKSAVPNFVKMGSELKNKLIETLGTNGVLICATYPTQANYHGELYTKLSASLYSTIFNVLGMPATHVPLGIGKYGLPIGVQVVAAPHQDRLCLAVAKVLEEGFGGWVPPPSMLP